MYKCPHCGEVERYHYLNECGDMACWFCEKTFRADDLVAVKESSVELTAIEKQEYDEIQARDAAESEVQGSP